MKYPGRIVLDPSRHWRALVGLSNVVAEVLPVVERTADNQGYRVLSVAPAQ